MGRPHFSRIRSASVPREPFLPPSERRRGLARTLTLAFASSSECASVTLGDAEVHVWFASLKVDDAYLLSSTSLLFADERVRATGFHFPQHQKRFIAGRGI